MDNRIPCLITFIICLICTQVSSFLTIIFLIASLYFLWNCKGKTYDEYLEEDNEELQQLQNKIDDKQQECDKLNEEIESLNEEVGTTKTLSQKHEELNDLTKRIDSKNHEVEKLNQEIGIDKSIKHKKEEVKDLKHKVDELNKEIGVDKSLKNKKREELKLKNKLEEMNKELDIDRSYQYKSNQVKEFESKLKKYNEEMNLNKSIQEKREMLNSLDEDLAYVDYGLIDPKFEFESSKEYKEALKDIRDEEKRLVKYDGAAVCSTTWTINESLQQGKKFTKANIKQLINNFNLECDVIISKVTYRTREKGVARIRKAFDKLNKMNETNAVYITDEYLNLKIKEMHLQVDYLIKKQQEKEELQHQREIEKEEKKVQKELDKKQHKIEKEKEKLQKQLEEEQKELERDQENQKLRDRIKELEEELLKQDENIEEINDRRKRKGPGFVYIISNFGSFGEDVYKIGVTRREEPERRVSELSNASVPFKYDVHAFIYTKDAFDLERKLHEKFNATRVNKINTRKEFFKLTKDDIQSVVDEYEDSVYNFNLDYTAEEYYQTLNIEKQQQSLD